MPRFFLLLLISLYAITGLADTLTHEKTLSNGLKVIVREDHRAPVFISQLWYRVGSTYEPQGLTGISHIVEHMMFKGTHKIKPGEFSRLIANVGGSDNAFTADDVTVYHQTLSKDHLPFSLKLEADRMQNLTLSNDEYIKEIKVIMEERRMRTDDNPVAQLHERFANIAYMNSYGQPTIGWMHDLEQITIDDVRAWYKKWYAPNNATLVVVGDVTAQAVFDLAEQTFGKIPKSNLPPFKTITNSDNPGERTLNVSLPAQVPYLVMGFNVPTLKTATQAWEAYALTMLAAVLDGGSSARLEDHLVRGQEIASQVGAGYGLYNRGDDLFTLSGVPNIEKHFTSADLERALWKEIDAIQKTPPTQQELERIKAQLISGLVYEKDSIESQASDIGQLESLGFPWKLADEELAHLSQVTPQQIQAVAQKYLTKDRLTTGTLIPNGKPVSSRAVINNSSTQGIK